MAYTQPNKNKGGGLVHNPEPSTERGRRRHAERSDEEKARAVAAWQWYERPSKKK